MRLAAILLLIASAAMAEPPCAENAHFGCLAQEAWRSADRIGDQSRRDEVQARVAALALLLPGGESLSGDASDGVLAEAVRLGVATDRFDAALRIAGAIRGPALSVEVHSTLAQAAHAAGEAAVASSSMRAARDAAREVAGVERIAAFGRLAGARLAAKDPAGVAEALDAAWAALETAPPEAARAGRFAFAEAAARAGEWEAAHAAARGFDRAQDRREALLGVAAVAAERRDEGALIGALDAASAETAAGAPASDALRSRFAALAAAGRALGRARAEIGAITSAGYRSYAQKLLAAALAEDGRLDAAREAASGIGDGTARDAALLAIAAAEAGAGDETAARATIGKMENQLARAVARAELWRALSTAGGDAGTARREALAAADAIAEPFGRALAFLALAGAAAANPD